MSSGYQPRGGAMPPPPAPASASESHLTELLVRGGTAWVRHTLERLERGEGFNPDVWRTLAGYAMEVTRHLELPADELQGKLSPGERATVAEPPCDDPHCITRNGGTYSGMAYDD